MRLPLKLPIEHYHHYPVFMFDEASKEWTEIGRWKSKERRRLFTIPRSPIRVDRAATSRKWIMRYQ
jgi:hypothetical protein